MGLYLDLHRQSRDIDNYPKTFGVAVCRTSLIPLFHKQWLRTPPCLVVFQSSRTCGDLLHFKICAHASDYFSQTFLRWIMQYFNKLTNIWIISISFIFKLINLFSSLTHVSWRMLVLFEGWLGSSGRNSALGKTQSFHHFLNLANVVFQCTVLVLTDNCL